LAIERDGHTVIEADNGVDALERLLAPNGPRLAILDWIMPEIEGVEVCRRIRENRDHGELYIIVVTAHSDQDGVVSALEAGADDFLTKPCRQAEILARIRAGKRVVDLHRDKIDMLSKLQQQQRLKSIGQLAAGIAHEINTPVQYIGDNTRFISDALGDVMAVVRAAEDLASSAKQGLLDADSTSAFDVAVQAADLAFLSEQIPLAVNQSLEGLARVADIVRAMKEFAHPGSDDFTASDLNHAVESMITVTRNEWKYVADLETALDPDLPPVPCLSGDISQVIINLIVNAAQAIEEKRRATGQEKKGQIEVRTRMSESKTHAELSIADTGCGIPKSVQSRVFDPFFTTKAVGKGTGQGLTLAYSVVVDKHQGEITFDTEEDKGTTFNIRLPLSRLRA
jgi:signal transduction histidine kinase